MNQIQYLLYEKENLWLFIDSWSIIIIIENKDIEENLSHSKKKIKWYKKLFKLSI